MQRSRTVLTVTAIALLIVFPVIGVAVARAVDDRPLLHDVRSRALPLFEETERLIDPAFASRPHPGSERAADPFDIPNDPFGYDQCDAWRDWILPGWAAGTWHDVDVASDRERRGIVNKVRLLWEQQDGELTVRDTDNARPLQLQIDQVCYTLTFPVNKELPMVPDGSVSVSTDCLPVE